jgi:hypothetical protein
LGSLASDGTSSSAQQVNDEDYQPHYQKQVDEASANVQTETQQPQDKQNNENCPKHVSLPADPNELKLTNLVDSFANDFTTSLSFPKSQVWSEKLGLGARPHGAQAVRPVLLGAQRDCVDGARWGNLDPATALA